MFLAVLILVPTNSSTAQWRRLAQFDAPISRVTLMYGDDAVTVEKIFVGTWKIRPSISSEPNIPSKIWKWERSTATWKNVWQMDIDTIGSIVPMDIVFKNKDTGWFTINANSSQFPSGIYRSTDGGESWEWKKINYYDRSNSVTFYWSYSLKYVAHTEILLLGRYVDAYFLASSDNGDSWYVPSSNTAIPIGPTQGFTFVNDSVGFGFSLDWKYVAYYKTTDGGISWKPYPYTLSTYQPTVLGGKIYAISRSVDLQNVPNDHTVDSFLYVSKDTGTSWQLISALPNTTQVIETDSTQLFVQTRNYTILPTVVYYKGIYASTDSGYTWHSICGPDGYIYRNRFWTDRNGLWAGDNFGTLWYNKTKKGAGPRLRVQNSSADVVIGKKAIADVFYSDSLYYEPLDSMNIAMKLSGDMLKFASDSVADGWTFVSREVTDSTLYYRLRWTGTSLPEQSTFMLRVYFDTYASRETAVELTLDEVNFNQDVTFRACMEPTLSWHDTTRFVLSEDCYTPYLRDHLRSLPVLNIFSLHPNPTSENITVDFSSRLEREVILQVLDDLGRVIYEEKFDVVNGMNTRTIPLPKHWFGMFYVRLRMGRDVVTGSFVKQ